MKFQNHTTPYAKRWSLFCILALVLIFALLLNGCSSTVDASTVPASSPTKEEEKVPNITTSDVLNSTNEESILKKHNSFVISSFEKNDKGRITEETKIYCYTSKYGINSGYYNKRYASEFNSQDIVTDYEFYTFDGSTGARYELIPDYLYPMPVLDVYPKDLYDQNVANWICYQLYKDIETTDAENLRVEGIQVEDNTVIYSVRAMSEIDNRLMHYYFDKSTLDIVKVVKEVYDFGTNAITSTTYTTITYDQEPLDKQNTALDFILQPKGEGVHVTVTFEKEQPEVHDFYVKRGTNIGIFANSFCDIYMDKDHKQLLPLDESYTFLLLEDIDLFVVLK